MSADIQIYCVKTSPRLIYSLNLVFNNILGLEYEITENPDNSKPLVNYSSDRSVGGIFIQPEPLLFETGIRKQDVWVAHMDELPLFFQQPPEAGFFIDVFAFVFYLVSRYEEYLPFTRDEHGRFAAESSMAYKHNFLYRPVVDLWVQRFGNTLNLLYPGIKIRNRKYDNLLTIDVDQPFAYRGKGIVRNFGGMVRDLISGAKVWERLKCITGIQKDPYDTYDYLNRQAEKYNVPIKYFFTAGKRSRFDKNPNPARNCYRKLIRKTAGKHKIGLHPSYTSNKSVKILNKELKRLEKASDIKVDSTRKHFLLLSFPNTYQDLQSAGIKNDYTLGYAREPGFRAGIARPFLYYDLEKEESTDLLLIPFQYMDGTFQHYKRLTTDESFEMIKELVNETRNVGGLFVSLWHNISLTGKNEWEGWRSLFEKAIKLQTNDTISEE
ncbi:MAG: polysaccharide deacetylase family protein [Bacteroidales bacterium]|nr:polysaccharide deacetylase family protein [Bacteroidales bacterium]